MTDDEIKMVGWYLATITAGVLALVAGAVGNLTFSALMFPAVGVCFYLGHSYEEFVKQDRNNKDDEGV